MEKRRPLLPTNTYTRHGMPYLLSSRGLKLILLLIFFVSFTVWRFEYLDFRKPKPEPELENWLPGMEKGDWKVPLEAHIMSKCPDARDCLEYLVVPVMARLSPKINFTLSFIGKTTEPDDGVACMHGASECLGNILELCAAELYPDPKIYLGFTLCMSRRYPDIPDRQLVEDCALEHAVDFGRLNDCASREDGDFGMELLRASVRRSAGLNVTTSCTVRLDDEVRCIRDGGQWKNCEGGSGVDSLVRDIEKLYEERNASK